MMRKIIYFAGGCFWGVEKYFSLITGVLQTSVGYANGFIPEPNYEIVKNGNSGYSETVLVEYRTDIVNLETLLQKFYQIIDPTSINKQGNDIGSQYRTGIYYIDQEDYPIIVQSIKHLSQHYEKPIAIEVCPLKNFIIAEDYHQKYLNKNPNGYCHINFQLLAKANK